MRLWGLALLVLGSFVLQCAVAVLSISALDGFGSWGQFEDDLGRLFSMFVSPSLIDGASWLIFAGALFLSLTQAAFLVPTFSPMAATGEPRSLAWTVRSAACLVAVFSALWLLALVTLIDLYIPVDPMGGLGVAIALLTTLVVSWFYWSRVFAAAARASEEPERAILRRVFGATGLLIVATIPLDVMTRRKTDCYCGQGSIWALAWGIASGVWLLGPWALGGMTRQMRRSLSGSFCTRCGHARGSISIVICPECGHQFRIVSSSQKLKTDD